MKLKASLLLGVILAASNAFVLAAGYSDPGGEHRATSGYTGPGAVATVTTVAAAIKAADDTPAVLSGHITQRLRKEHYLFKDDSGTITVEIDNDAWPAQSVSETTPVRLYGEVEHKKRGEREIDVDRVEIVQ